MKVLLTGATGFLGRNLEPILSAHHEVTATGSKDCDLRSTEEIDNTLHKTQPDVVVHAAGVVGGIGANKDNPGKFLYENLMMGSNLIHRSMINKVPKFILLGTVCAYPKFAPVPFKEDDLWNGYPEETNAPYGVAKKALMEMLIAYCKQYGMNGTNLIPVNMYGPHDHFNLTSSHVIPALILKVRDAIENKSPSISVWGTGQVSREFLYAEDCAKAIQLAIEKDTGPQPINIGTGVETKIYEVVEQICNVMGYEGDVMYDTSKPDGQPRRCLDTSRAKKLLGFEASTDLKSGLAKTIEFFNLKS